MPSDLNALGLRPKHVPVRELVEPLRAVDAWCRRTGSHNWFALTPLSTFFDPAAAEYVSRSELVLEGTISIAITSKADEALVAAAVAVDANRSKEVGHFLREVGCPVIALPTGDRSLESLLDSIAKKSSFRRGTQSPGERWLVGKVRTSLRPPVDPAVRRAYEHLGHGDYLKRREERLAARFRLFREISLGAVIGFKEPFEGGQRIRSRLWRSRCDALVATSPPDSQPVLVVEFDGAHHRRDDGPIKDFYRDQYLLSAGIAVLRVSSETQSLRGLDFANGLHHVHRRTVDEFVEYLISEVANDIWYWHHEYPKEQAPKEAWICEMLRKFPGDVTDAALRGLLARANELFYEHEATHDADRYLAVSERALSNSWGIVREVTSGRAELIDVQFLEDEAVVWAKGSLQFQDGRQSHLSTPRFIVSLELPPGAHSRENNLVSIRREAAIHSLIQQALFRAEQGRLHAVRRDGQ